MGDDYPLKRRSVLKAGTSSVLFGTTLLGKVSANDRSSNPAIALRGTPQNSISPDEVKDELRDADQYLTDELGNTKAHDLIEGNYIHKSFQNKDDVIAFNLIAQDGKLSIYTGRSIGAGAGKTTAKVNSHSRIHERADEHLTNKKSNMTTYSNSDFGNVSDYREETDLTGIDSAEGYAQLRTYVDEYNDNKNVKVIRSRVDQRVENPEGVCDTYISQNDQTITHDHNEDSVELDDWSPNPNNEDSQSGSSTITLSRSGVEYSYTYDHTNDITVTDDSPFEEETARARIEMPGRSATDNPDRIRASNASLVKINEGTITPVTWDLAFYVFDYYSGRCVHDTLSTKLTSYPYLTSA